MPATGSLRDLLALFARHWGKMLLLFVTTMAAVVLGIIWCPRTYESQARLHVLIGRESIGVDPTATTGPSINMMETRDQEINTVRDLLRSRTVFEDVVAQIGAEKILNPKPKEPGEESTSRSWKSVVHDWMLNINLADPVSPQERAISKLAENVHVEADANSSVIKVEFRSGTPQMAQQIGVAFLEAYADQHSRAHRMPGSHEFFERQADLLGEKLAAAEQQLRDVKNEQGIVTIGQAQQTLGAEIELIEIDLLTTSVAIEAARAKADALRASLDSIPERLVVQETTESSLAADQMRQTLYDLQIQEKALAAKHTDEHPLVVAIREQVAAAQELLDSEEKLRTQPTMSLNPASQQQELALLQEEATIEGLDARQQALRQRMAELNEKLHALNEQELRIGQLERDVTLRREEYLTYTRNEELARLDQALETNRISNVNVVQPPTYSERPVSPPKAILMVLGVMLGGTGAVVLALVAEGLRRPTPAPEPVARRDKADLAPAPVDRQEQEFDETPDREPVGAGPAVRSVPK